MAKKTLKDAKHISEVLKEVFPDNADVTELNKIIVSEMKKRNGTFQKAQKDNKKKTA